MAFTVIAVANLPLACRAGYLLFRLRQYQKLSLHSPTGYLNATLLIARSAANAKESGQSNWYTADRAGSVPMGEALSVQASQTPVDRALLV